MRTLTPILCLFPAALAVLVSQQSPGAAQQPSALRVPNDGTSTPPRLLVYQAMWAMESLPRGAEKPWTQEERFAKIAEGGWDGVDLVAANPNEFDKIAGLAETNKLRVGLLCFPTKPEDLEIPLQAATRLHADYLNSQIFPYPLPTDKAVE